MVLLGRHTVAIATIVDQLKLLLIDMHLYPLEVIKM